MFIHHGSQPFPFSVFTGEKWKQILYLNIHSSFICNCSKQKTTGNVHHQENRWTHNETLLINEKVWITNTWNNTDVLPRHQASERRQTQKATYSKISFICNPRKCKLINVNRQKTGQKLPRERPEGGMTKAGGNIWGDRCVRCLDQGNGFTGVDICQTHQIVHVKYV